MRPSLAERALGFRNVDIPDLAIRPKSPLQSRSIHRHGPCRASLASHKKGIGLDHCKYSAPSVIFVVIDRILFHEAPAVRSNLAPGGTNVGEHVGDRPATALRLELAELMRQAVLDVSTADRSYHGLAS